MNKVLKSGKWQRYKYAVAALIAIMVFCGFIFSYIAVVVSAAAPATKALNNISITNYTPLEPNGTNPPLFNFRGLKFGYGYLNVSNTGDQTLTLTLTMSAVVNSSNTLYVTHTNQYVGSAVIPNITIDAHSSEIISATVNDTAPEFHFTSWNQKPSGYWSYSCSVQASITVDYLFWHPPVSYKTFDFNGSAIIF